jgi:hypothetical protein
LRDHLKAWAFQCSDLLLELFVLLPKLVDVLSLHRFSEKQPFAVAVYIRDLLVVQMLKVLVWCHIMVQRCINLDVVLKLGSLFLEGQIVTLEDLN